MLAATIAIGAAACGNSGGGDAAPNACDVLTTEEVEELLGVPVHGGSEDTDRTRGTYCEWVSKDTGDGGDASSAGGDDDSDVEAYFLSVVIDQGVGPVQGFAAGTSEPGEADDGEGPAYEPVEGLGDDAYFDVTGGLKVRKGDLVFSTYTRATDEHPLMPDERKDIELGAAELIVERVGDPGGGTDIAAATECGETGRCLGSRFRACDLLLDAEVEAITGLVVTDVDGQIERTESENGGVCDYDLEDPRPPESSRARGIDVFVEPDRDAAEEKFEEVRRDAKSSGTYEPLTGIGDEAFSSRLSVYVLSDGKFLELSYVVQLPDFTDDTSAATVQTNVELATAAAERL
jgi:hypothetical protein